MRFRHCLFLLVPLTVGSLCHAADTKPGGVQIGVKAEFAYESSDFLRKYEYASPEKMFASSAADGAFGANIPYDKGETKRWFIEEQRWGRDLVLAGIVQKQPLAIDRGLRMLSWGFQHQNADGYFSCPDTFHSTSFFVDAVADSILMLGQSEFAERYKAQTNAMIPKLLASAQWMIRPEVQAEAFRGPLSEAPFAHRRYLVAAALGEAGIVTGDHRLLDAAAESARAGMAMQDISGYNPEKGGYDSSYHAVGVVFAQRYYTLAAPPELRPALASSIHRAVDWSASRLRPDGTMILTGNTRVNGEPEKNRTGTPKQPSYRGTFRLLYRWYLLSGDETYLTLATRVAKATPASTMPAYLPVA